MKWTPEMAEAARLLGLDPDDERHRKLLIMCVRAAGKKRGRPKGSEHWTPDRLISLGRVAERIWFENRKAIKHSDTKLAKLIFKMAEKGEFRSVEAVRRHLPKALLWYELWWEKDQDHVDPPEHWSEDY